MKKIKAKKNGVNHPSIFMGRGGFSFVELVVVIALIGILAAIAVPTILTMTPNIRLKSAARDLYSNLQRARMEALKNNTSIQVRFVDTAVVDTLYFDLNADGINDLNEYTFNLTNYGSGVGYGAGTADQNWNGDPISSPITASPITFSNRGTANQGTVYIQNQNQDICYAVTVNLTGSIRLRRFFSPGWE